MTPVYTVVLTFSLKTFVSLGGKVTGWGEVRAAILKTKSYSHSSFWNQRMDLGASGVAEN